MACKANLRNGVLKVLLTTHYSCEQSESDHKSGIEGGLDSVVAHHDVRGHWRSHTLEKCIACELCLSPDHNVHLFVYLKTPLL